MPVYRYLDLSTGHLTEAEMVELSSAYSFGDLDHSPRVIPHDYGAWVQRLPGRVIACENVGADWLPFRSLASIKSTRGRSEEAVYLQGYDAGRPNLAAFGL